MKKIPIPACLYLCFVVLFHELCLHLWISNPVLPGRLLTVCCFALGFGSLGGLLCSLLPSPRRAKGTAMLLAILVTLLWLTEYFILDTFQSFMTPNTILNGAGGVATDYLSVVLTLLWRNLWRIGLCLLPTVLYGLLAQPLRGSWKQTLGMLLSAALWLGLGYGALYGLTQDFHRLGSAYEFDTAVRSMGLNMAFLQEATHTANPQQQLDFQPPIPTEPETLPAQTEEAVVYGYNAMEQLDAAALAQTATGAAQRLYQYLAALSPSRQNPYTGRFAGKNLILITAESFTAEAIDPELTPTLYRLANEGIRFSEYYQPAWGASTISGEFSNVTGFVPTNGGMCMKEVKQQNFFLTMGHQLQQQNYFSMAVHNNDKNFYDRVSSHTRIGYDKFLALYGGLNQVQATWPESDLEMLQETLPQYIGKSPFSIYYMTVSGHCMYTQDQNAMSKKNYHLVETLNHSEPVKCYLAAQLELEAAMKYLVEELEAAGIADDTVIVIATDHYPYALERSVTWGNEQNRLSELFGVDEYDHFQRDHSGLIIWSGDIEGENIRVDTPVYSLDILPTLLNLFGLEYDSRLLVGRDVFSEQMPLALWLDHSWITEKGSYDSLSGVFTPRAGQSADKDYIDAVCAQVANKINYSKTVLETDFFNTLTKDLGLPQKW